jgi:hypothetical protein
MSGYVLIRGGTKVPVHCVHVPTHCIVDYQTEKLQQTT